MSKKSYEVGRRCDSCGSKMPPFFPRKRRGDDLLCETCFTREAKNAYLGIKDGDIVIKDDYPGVEYQVLEDPQGGEVGIRRLFSTDEFDEGEIVSVDDLTVVGQLSSRRVAHDSPGTDILYHCPFCGAGQLTGGSDGTTTCGFCDASFTVQTQPNKASMPQTIDGDPYVDPEEPIPGEFEEEEIPEETETVLEEEEELDTETPFDLEKDSYKIGNAEVSEDEYLRHLAITHADDRNAVLRAVRASRRG